ncbi:hypothetical protein Glove_395g77 [Diversispora epigaea]|uniref:Glycosyltransferase family 49 protein n=1 Tax=Diversispora epigaea TaxID=1348612 RepID=A0A397H9C0_9GLOM|nr:hypothetical protein Glove_395g77 [Diversispora epigaea]
MLLIFKRRSRCITSFIYRRRPISILIFLFLFFLIWNKLTTKTNKFQEIQKSFKVDSLVNNVTNENNKVIICNNNNKCSSWEPKYWKDNDLKRESIYHDVKTIKVPLGISMYLVTEENKRLLIPMGFTNCTDQEICKFVTSLDISADLKLALEQIAKFSEDDYQKKKELIYYHNSKLNSLNKDDVTLVTQFSVNRLDRFENALAAWPGPISAVIYLVSPNDINPLLEYFKMDKNLYLYNRVTLTIFKPDYSTDTYLKYPINLLRNMAIKVSFTEYYFVMDADFVPTSQLYNFSVSLLIPLLQKFTQPTAFVVPCIAIKENYSGKYPNTISELRKLFNEGWAYITDKYAGHGPTGNDIFLSRQILNSHPYYEICYESQWEPYYILSKSAPLYDERFRNQGGDKQQHTLLLNALGYRFLALRDHFIYHMDHENLIWPGGGLKQGQLSKDQFNYFEHYIPEIQAKFGTNSRWPRGCSRPLIKDQMRDLLGIGVG